MQKGKEISVVLKNKLNIENEAKLAKEEERLSKIRACELFENNFLDKLNSGSFEALCEIHKYLFGDIYEFAGRLRDVNIAKGNFRFTPIVYLKDAIKNIERMPQSNYDEIVEKYIEMNIAHPFREGNGRSMRIWLDLMLKTQIKKIIDWQRVDKNDYMLAMERSPIKDTEIKLLLKNALSDKINDAKLYKRGIDESYRYEGYTFYKAIDLKG